MTLIIIKFKRNLQKLFVNIEKIFKISKFFANKSSSTAVIKKSSIIFSISSFIELFIKHFRMNFDFDLRIDYDFRN